MTATAQSDGTILVEWETATELDTASFRLYRGLSLESVDMGHTSSMSSRRKATARLGHRTSSLMTA